MPATTRRKLEAIGQTGSVTGLRRKTALAPGAMLLREYDGAEYRVTVQPDGRFEHAGRTFTSLSAVARHITGTQWNGHRFFGLRKEAR